MEPRFNIYVTGNAPSLYPCDSYFGILRYDHSNAMEIPEFHPYQEEWGEIISSTILIEKDNMPKSLDMVYLSIVERQFYSVEAILPTERMETLWQKVTQSNKMPYTHIVVGMAPYGHAAIWFRGAGKSTLIDWVAGETINISMALFNPINPQITLDEVCDYYIKNDERVRENLEVNGLPARDLFDRYMQQFCYRYLVMFERWDEAEQRWVKPELDEDGQPVDGKPLPEFDFIEEALWDGTHDKLRDGGLMSYHQAGKPKKLALEWHIKKSQYSAYLWFEDEAIRSAFEKFYGAHRDTKVDFIIRIDHEKNKYELALYRYGLQKPVVISEKAYQMIVFKSKFEYYRSENYDQPKGAWIW